MLKQKAIKPLQRANYQLSFYKKFYESEKPGIMKMRKKIVAAKNLPKGHIVRKQDIALKSPGDGTSPIHFEKLIGKKLNRVVKKDQTIQQEFII